MTTFQMRWRIATIAELGLFNEVVHRGMLLEFRHIQINNGIFGGQWGPWTIVGLDK